MVVKNEPPTYIQLGDFITDDNMVWKRKLAIRDKKVVAIIRECEEGGQEYPEEQRKKEEKEYPYACDAPEEVNE